MNLFDREISPRDVGLSEVKCQVQTPAEAPAPYPSLAVRARNGRVAGHPEAALNSVCDYPQPRVSIRKARQLGTFA